eukprot:scaffold396_cov252-Pinguiococcus_pyrenoidosus.AAC.2
MARSVSSKVPSHLALRKRRWCGLLSRACLVLLATLRSLEEGACQSAWDAAAGSPRDCEPPLVREDRLSHAVLEACKGALGAARVECAGLLQLRAVRDRQPLRQGEAVGDGLGGPLHFGLSTLWRYRSATSLGTGDMFLIDRPCPYCPKRSPSGLDFAGVFVL